MKKILLPCVLIIVTLFGIGCGKPNYNHLLLEPRYNQAQYRAEIGNLFYETDKEIGITTSFGFFIYNLSENRLSTAFAVDGKKAFGEDFFVDARLSKDEKSILLLGYSHEKNINDYYYRYDVKTGNLYKEEHSVDRNEFYPLPDQSPRAFETNNWTAEELAYYPPNSNLKVSFLSEVIMKVIISLILLIISYGYLRLKRWGYWLMVSFNVYFLVGCIISFQQSGQRSFYQNPVAIIIGLIFILPTIKYFDKVTFTL